LVPQGHAAFGSGLHTLSHVILGKAMARKFRIIRLWTPITFLTAFFEEPTTKKVKLWQIKNGKSRVDTFEGGSDAYYPLFGKFDDEPPHSGRTQYLAELEKTQPTSESEWTKRAGHHRIASISSRPDEPKYRFTG